MKRIFLWRQNLGRSILLDLLLLFVVAVSIFFLTNAYGVYRYIALADRALTSTLESNSAVYYMDLMEYSVTSQEDLEQIFLDNQRRLNLINTVSKAPGVRTVLCNKSFAVSSWNNLDLGGLINCSAMICSKDLQQMFPQLSQGEWFDYAENEDGTFNAVLCGENFYDIPIGTTINLCVPSSNEDKVFTIKVCGLLYAPSLIPTFSGSGTTVNTDSFYSSIPAVLVGECETFSNFFVESEDFHFTPCLANFFLDFQPNATETQIKAVYDVLSQTGGYLKVDDIRAANQRQLDSILKQGMVMPIFYMVISFIIYFSITILYVFRQAKTFAVYYLLGYSKRRIIWNVASHTGILILLASIINVVYVKMYYAWIAIGWLELNSSVRHPYYDSHSILIIVGISLVMFFITLFAALGILRKKSPSDFWLVSKE